MARLRDESIVELNHVNKTYASKAGHKVEALRDVDFSVNPTDFVSIVGSSGSGKTSLLNVMSLLDRPTSGKISVSGRDIETLSDKELARIRRETFGFVFQDYSLLPNMTVFSNVSAPLVYGTDTRQVIKEKVEGSLKRIGIADLSSRRPNELSGGQKQRVALARAIINSPSVIFADEPTGALDSGNTEQVLDLLRSLNSEGLTIVLVTHDLELAQMAKTRCIMKDGVLESHA